jgi:hypothetical protein
MKINLINNNFNKYIDINISEKLGIILDKLLNNCSLLIYNIEDCEIITKNESYLFGSEEAPFDISFEHFLKNINKTEDYIEKIIINDRIRDVNGNVIKGNNTIEKYNKWFQLNENENFINNVYNPPHENSHLIRYPITSFLDNILRVPLINQLDSLTNEFDTLSNEFDTLSNRVNQLDILSNRVNQLDTLSNRVNQLDTLSNRVNQLDTLSNEISNDQNMLNENNESKSEDILPINDLNQISNDNNSSEEETIQDENLINDVMREVINDYRPIETNVSLNQFNNLINIIDNYIRNTEHLYINDVLPTLDNFNNIILNEDVKIILDEEEFDNLERIKYDKSDKSLECLICLDTFEEEENLIKIKCNHIFHCNCIKNWLCEESNKCPVCRIEVGKGKHI